MDVAVPQPLAEEIVQQYADVLRVGRVLVNGSEVCWSTSGSTPSQLEAFSVAFCRALRSLPESQGLEDAVLHQAVYWFCKIVSINYVLCEVLHVIKEKVGKECSIRTSGHGGRSIVDYCVEVQPDHLMRVHLTWKEKGNIIHCDPKTARKKVKGTLSSLETVFPIPPNECFTPTYSLNLNVKKSYKEAIVSKVAWMAKNKKQRQRCREGECIYPDSPLHSSSSSFLESASTACSTEQPCSLSSEISTDSVYSWDSSDFPREISSPLHFQTRSVRTSPSFRDGAEVSLRDTARGFVCQAVEVL